MMKHRWDRIETSGVLLTSTTTAHLLRVLVNTGYTMREAKFAISSGEITLGDGDNHDFFYGDKKPSMRMSKHFILMGDELYDLIPDTDGVIGTSHYI